MSIKDPETERLAKRLAHLTGGQSRKAALLEGTAESRRRWSEMPVVDDRTPETQNQANCPGKALRGAFAIRSRASL
jgi:hypothetical protein